MKQPQLNGAYYGPPAPPPSQAYYSAGRRSSCGPCLTLLRVVVTLVVILGIVALVLWLVLRPNEIKAYADAATLTRFDLAPNNNSLQYNLTVDISIRNPNRRIGIYYDYVEAQALYDDARFGFEILPPFYQGHKSTNVIKPAFQGQGFLVGDGTVASTYSREKGQGYYYVEVKVYTKLRLKIWIFKIHHVKTKIDCKLQLPVPGESTSAAFSRTKCDVDF